MGETRRKIAILLSANVVGYSRLMATDDPRRVEALNVRRVVFKRFVAEHGGREFGTVAGNRIVEFPSALNALQCAIAIQQTIRRENESAPSAERLLWRIGLHVGEVVEEADGSFLGDGVDAATQMQALAAPGGISLSGALHDHVKHQARFERTGEQRLKGIAEPVATYQVLELGVERASLDLWSELKRRNVFRVAAAYAVGAWVAIQAASIVVSAFDSPEWMMRAVVVAGIAGFPLTLVFAWLYELTPLGLKRDVALGRVGIPELTGRRVDRGIIGLLVVAVVFLIFDNYISLQREPQAAQQATIAVLAFDNLSADAGNEYFSDGVADELLNVLARIPELKVSSRTSSFNFKGKDVDVATIAETLMVDNVLEGSVRRDGNRVRVTATLIRDGAVHWTDIYDRDLEDILNLQTEIAHSVALAIVPVLSPESERRIAVRPTNSLEAYDFYLRGREYLRQPSEEATLVSAAKLFDQAIQLDPRFAAAWAARCETRLGQYEFSPGERRHFDQAQADCRQAWTLDQGLWEVYVALARLYLQSGLYEEAIAELESAIVVQPNSVEAYLVLGSTYSEQNRSEQAESMFKKAIEVDRGYWGVYRLYGNFLYDHERYLEAIEQYSLVVQFTPDSGIGLDNLGNAYWAIGDFAKAAQAFERSLEIGPSRWAYSNLGSMQYYLGNFTDAVANQLRAIELAPENQEAWGRLAEAYRFIPGKEADAISAYATAIELVKRELLINPDDWIKVALLGQYYAFTDRQQEAVVQMRRVLELAPTAPTAYYFDALVKWHHGEHDAAYLAVERALELGLSPIFVSNDPDLAPLTREERFQRLLVRHTNE